MDRVYNEDCISGMKAHVRSDSIDLVIADPPFAIRADSNRIEALYNRNSELVIDDYIEVAQEAYAQFSKDWINQVERVLRPSGSGYIISGYTNLKDIMIALDESNLQLINHIIWKFNFGVWTVNKYVSSHYHILFFKKDGKGAKKPYTFNTFSRFGRHSLNENGGKANYSDREDVWNIKRDYHPNEMKTKNRLPVELVGKMVDYSSNKGDKILDPFCGSFTTWKVTKGCGRKFVGFEKSAEVFKFGIKHVESVA